MGYKLLTCEKPSVAADISKVIGASDKKAGFFIGNGYIVTWAVGHLVGLVEPEEYGYVSLEQMWNRDNPQYKDNAYNELPLIPSQFKTKVLERTKEQFNIMKTLMLREDVDYIIDCGDPGPEGHILQWFIRVKAGCIKPVKRFIATSMTPEAIKQSMANLRNAEDFKYVIIGEFCKKRADWILGMSMSRCASIKYSAKVDVGRVQSPTLYFVVKRFVEVTNFKITDYYQMEATFAEGFKTFWKSDNTNRFPSSHKDSEGRLINKDAAIKTVQDIKVSGRGKITALETKKKATDRPQLYDITELQRDGNRIFNYSSDDVLQTAQTLYEKYKVTSYPRTDSRFLTSDIEPYLQQRVRQIASLGKFSAIANKLVSLGLNIDKKIIDDSKVTDHHAIIVTEKIENFNMDILSEKERNILQLVIIRMLVAFSQRYTYNESIVNVTFSNGFVFGAKGRIPISMGWKDIQSVLTGKDVDEDEEQSDKEDKQIFSNISLGQIVNIKDISVLPKQTTPPKLHTEATLLTAMENAGSQVDNGAILKGKGIGTPATRSSIIKSLFEKGYVQNKLIGKSNYLVPTKQGINTIKVIPSDLYSPKITADWEEKIAKIQSGMLTEQQFMNEFETFIKRKVQEVKNDTIEGVNFEFEREEFSKCPFCGKSVYSGTITDKTTDKKVDSFYCSDKECKFSITKNNLVFITRTGKNLTSIQAKKLITEHKLVTTCKSKNGVEYKGCFTLVKNPKGYAALNFDLVESKKKKQYKH